jgi:VanZ family protein
VALLQSPRLGELTGNVPGESTESQSRLPLALWIASAVFIVYGTTIPFNFVADSQAAWEHLARLNLNPFIAADTGRRVSIPDFVSNLLLFGPFGFFGIWTLSRPRSLGARIAIVAALGFALSAGVEVLQLFTVDRTSSISDLFANSAGALGGAVAALLLLTFVEAFLRTVGASGIASCPSFFPLLVATIVLLAGALEPFDVTIDVGSVFPKLRGFLHDPVQLAVPVDEALSFLRHVLFASTLVVWLEEVGMTPAATAAAAISVAFACVAEASQLFIGSRMPGLWDAGVGIAGALVGVATARAWVSPRGTSSGWLGVFLLTAVGAAMQQLSPFTISGDSRSIQWMPFYNYYAFTTSQTVSHSAELLIAYFPLGFAVAASSRRRRFSRRVLPAVVAALIIALPIEYLQQFVGGRFPDVTDVALSVAGAWLGAWTAVQGRRMFEHEIAVATGQRTAIAPST